MQHGFIKPCGNEITVLVWAVMRICQFDLLFYLKLY